MPAWKKICCAIDGSDASLEALRTAAMVARQANAELVLVHVEAPTSEVLLAPPPAPARRIQGKEARLTQWSDLARELRGAPVRIELGFGPTAQEIVAAARREECDLLVLGTKSKHTAAFALGSVAAHVIPHARCSVLLVRGPR